MATQLLEVPVITKVGYEANNRVQILLPRSNPIRRIIMEFKITIKAGSTVPTIKKNNDLFNLIKNIQLEGGVTTIFSFSALQKYLLMTKDFGVNPVISTFSSPTANSSVALYIRLQYDFAINNKGVLRNLGQVLLPSNFSELKFSVDWGAIGDIYSTVSNGSIGTGADETYCKLSIVGAYNDGKDGDSLIPSEPPLLREITETDNAIEKEHTNLSSDARIVPITATGNLILQQLITSKKNITDGNPLLSDDVISLIKFEDIRGGRELYIQQTWNNLKAQETVDQSETVKTAGALLLDWADFRAGGLVVPTTESIQMQLTTQAPTTNKNNAVQVLNRFI